MGGVLSNPYKVDPRHPRQDRFLERHPYALPNIVAASFFCVSIITGFLFLQESLAAKRHERDYGLIIGAKITAWFRKTFDLKRQQKEFHAENEPLLTHQKTKDDEEAAPDLSNSIQELEEAPSIRDVLSYQTTLNLFVYTLLAFYTLAYDQVCIMVQNTRYRY